MIKLCRENKARVLDQIRSGEIDSATMSTSNLVDDIILAMHTTGILQCLKSGIPDKRADNTVIPFDLIWVLSIAAKMKVKTSLSDIPFAISDHRTLSLLGYNLVDTSGVGTGLMREGSLRFLLGKYTTEEFFGYYNGVVQNHISPMLNISPNIHVLDCTDLEVNFDNANYEGSGVFASKIEGKARGYKLSTIRGIYQDTGIIEDIRFGSINTHDLALSEDMVRTTNVLKQGDILINDRGFISRDVINHLKKRRGVDVYIPLRNSMDAYEYAVNSAKNSGEWQLHPNRKRTKQKITFVEDVGYFWQGSVPDDDVPLNACVVWDTETDAYLVFVTTDISKSARQIIKTYELRPEIEEDYRQLKDFWKLDDFKSTKLNVIAFHIICVLFGYLFFQLYTTTDEGNKYSGKCLPVILKNYESKTQSYLVIYAGEHFGIFTLIELLEEYSNCSTVIKSKLKHILENV